jgi:tetratricopeptide (TPR) repeat protein
MSFSVSGLHAQKKETMKKRFREARTAIRTASGQENIERVLLDSIAQPTTTDKNEAEAYHMCALLQQSMNEALNMKAYLKQNLDTVKLYKTVLNIYAYTVKSDSVDDKRRFYSKNIKLRDLHRKNLLGGGKFLLRKSQWTEAYPFFDMFLKTCTTDMDSIVGRVAYWATVCGMNENNPYHVLEHVDNAIALTPKAEQPPLVEYKARSILHLGDSARWVELLDESVDAYPGYNYFFLNLMDYYMRHGMIEQGLARTDSLVRTDVDRPMYWFAMSMFALAQGDYGKCIDMSNECLDREPDNADALYNKGISLLNLALTEKKTERRIVFYRRALGPMERVRELMPDDIDRWGNPLYRIYLNLNMGSKFEEIDRLLEKHMREVRHSENQVMMHSITSSQEGKNMDKHLSKP